MRIYLWATVLAALAGLPTAWPAVAQEPPPAAPQTIIEVRVEGNEQMSDNAVLALVKTRAGQTYDEEVVKADERALLRTGRFSNVVVIRAETDQGVIVTFTVSERQLVSFLEFEGNLAFKADALQKELPFGVNDPLELGRIQRGRMAIADKYKEAGYYFVEVRIDEEALQRRQVVYEIVEGPRVTVKSVAFEGSAAFPSMRLRQLVRTSRAWWPFTRGQIDSQQLDRDVVNLRAFYREEGYLDAEVGRRLDFSPDKKTVEVTFIIHEGQRYRVAEARFEGNTVFADAELRARLDMTQGQYYTGLGLRRDTETLYDTYGEIGHIEASIAARTVYVDPNAPLPGWLALAEGEKPALVILVYEIHESDQFSVGRVTIRGNTVTQDRVIRRQLQFYPEQVYNTVAVQESRQALLESRLFDSVTITPYGDEEDVRNVLVTVQEGRTAEFVVGVGITTNSGVLGTVSFTQRNFNWLDWPESLNEFIQGQSFKGAGQILRLNVEPGTEIIRARLDWREPYLFDRPISLGTGLYVFTRPRETYDETRLGGQASLGKLFKNRWYGEVAGRFENVRIDNLDFDAPPEVIRDSGDSNIVGIKGTLVRDTTDSRWLPSRGDRLSISYEQIVGDYQFGKIDAGYTRYWTMYVDALDRKHILAARGQVELNTDDAPVFERYYGGGLGNVRGFEYRGISPRSAGTDEQIGGDFSVYLGAEYTFPIYGNNLRGAVFVDSGAVEEDYRIDTYRSSVGFGLRLLVPFFGPVPMSLDFGIPITKDSQDDTQLISFTFGWVF